MENVQYIQPHTPTQCARNNGGPHDWKCAPVVDLSVPYWCTACGTEIRMTLVSMIGSPPRYGRDHQMMARETAFNEHRATCETCAPHAPGTRLCDRGYLLTGKIICHTCLNRHIQANPEPEIFVPSMDCPDCSGLSFYAPDFA